MRILTYNLWHGLSGSGVTKFGELESYERRQKRYQNQLEILQTGLADIIFLQELNPVKLRAKQIANSLGMNQVHTVSNAGMKLMGLGIPSNLHSGIALLYRSPWELKSLKKVKLSGSPISFSKSNISFQWSESRYALLAEMTHPKFGSALFINAHLHHGFQIPVTLDSQLRTWHKEGQLDIRIFNNLVIQLRDGEIRRTDEVARLLEAIGSYKTKFRTVILGGDFNGSPQSVAVSHIQRFGFLDLWLEFHWDTEGYTWDKSTNEVNHEKLKQCPSTVRLKNTGLKGELLSTLNGQIKELETKARRIDYIFLKNESREEFKLLSVDLFATEAEEDGIVPSDHFGVLAEIGWD